MSMTFSGGYISGDDRFFAIVTTMGGRGQRIADFGDDAIGSSTDAAQALRNLHSEHAAVGVLNVDDDYFILVRQGVGSPHVVFSDITATVTDDITVDVFDGLDLDIPDLDEDELDDVDAWTEGDMSILADPSCSEKTLEFICDDQSLWTSEQLLAITEGSGCAERFADVAGLDYDGDDDDCDPYDG